MTELRKYWMPVAHHSAVDRAYHCCVHKTGSQWLLAILSDPMVFRHSGLSLYNYPARVRAGMSPDLRTRSYSQLAPQGSIVSPLYVTYDNFVALEDPGVRRAFFVRRDPRDILVSWVQSARKIHVAGPSRGMEGTRAHFLGLDERESLLFGIDYLKRGGRFEVLSSWARVQADDVMQVRFEDLVGPESEESFARLFSFLDIRLDRSALTDLIAGYSFENLTGRRRGIEDDASPMRRGAPGEWRAYFDSEISSRFREATGPLIADLGYEEE